MMMAGNLKALSRMDLLLIIMALTAYFAVGAVTTAMHCVSCAVVNSNATLIGTNNWLVQIEFAKTIYVQIGTQYLPVTDADMSTWMSANKEYVIMGELILDLYPIFIQDSSSYQPLPLSSSDSILAFSNTLIQISISASSSLSDWIRVNVQYGMLFCDMGATPVPPTAVMVPVNDPTASAPCSPAPSQPDSDGSCDAVILNYTAICQWSESSVTPSIIGNLSSKGTGLIVSASQCCCNIAITHT